MRIFILINFILINLQCYGDLWIQKSSFPGPLRHIPTSFSISGKGYVGQGRNPLTNGQFKDNWEYDPIADIWIQKTDRPTEAYGASGFSILGKGYSVGDVLPLINQCWEYDPILNVWTQKADYPGNGAGFLGAKFEINNKGYVGLGGNGNWASDFWEFDPQANTWTAKASMNVDRQGLISFSILGKGYVGSGKTSSPTGTIYQNDFWEFDPLLNSWTQKANLPGLKKVDAVGFSINNKGYMGMGHSLPFTPASDFWEYDPTINNWTQKTDYPGFPRGECASFSIGNTGYVGVGVKYMTYSNEFWAYSPDTLSGISESIEPRSSNYLKVFPNPAKNFISVTISKDVVNSEVFVVSSAGQNVFSMKNFYGNRLKIDVASFSPGIYFIKVLEKNKLSCSKKFIVE